MLKQSSGNLNARRRILPGFRLFAVLAVCWLCAASLFAAEGRFAATLDRDSVVIGEAVTLTLQFEGGAPRTVPGIPQVPGLATAPGMSTSVNTSLGPDGAMTSIQSYIVTLVPQRAGDFVIPPITADLDGRKVQSQPLRLKVLQSDPTAPPPEYAEKLAFLWLTLPKTELYVGEVLVAELRLYLRGDVRNLSQTQIPPLAGDGFNSGKFVEAGRFQRRVGNTPFTIIPLKVAVTPVKNGTLTLGPMNGSLVVHVATGRRRSDPFDLDSFFGPSTEPRQVPLTLAEQSLKVLPLPAEGRPADFRGAVGNYIMAASMGPTNLAVGDPITIKLQISGQGQLDTLALPELTWRDFKVYPPTSRVETKDQLGIQGTKFFEQVVVPQTTDLKALPPVSFSFFDPIQKAYRTLTQPAVPLIVRPGGATPAPTVVAANRTAQDNPPPAQDIVHIKPRFGAVAQIGAPLIQQPWFLALQTVPILAWVSALLWRRRAESLARNPRLRRQRQVAQLVRDGLIDLRRLAGENKSEEFFAALVRLLQELLGERLDLPASAITEAVIDEHLRPRGASSTALAVLQELFQTCNLARYAPIKTSQELAALIPKFETAVRELQNLKK